MKIFFFSLATMKTLVKLFKNMIDKIIRIRYFKQIKDEIH